ncbi:MAG: alpha/beta fold hydrolase [Acidimicrobiia bacterium]
MSSLPARAGRLGGFVRTPAGPPRAVLACLAGGTCTTAYFDLRVPGLPGYSMAEHLTGLGFAVLAFDHLGLGASAVVDDLYSVTPTVAAAAQADAIRAALDRFPDAPAIGVGHSMGGMLLTVLQHDHALFDGIAVLGHGGDGLPEVLSDDEAALRVDRPYPEIERDIEALARVRFAPDSPVPRKRPTKGPFLLPDVPEPVREAFVAQQVSNLFTCGLTSMIPGATDSHKAGIDVPVFVAFGDHDLTDDHEGAREKYTATRDAELFVLADSGHCHNQANTRVQLWDRLAGWATRVADRADGGVR